MREGGTIQSISLDKESASKDRVVAAAWNGLRLVWDGWPGRSGIIGARMFESHDA